MPKPSATPSPPVAPTRYEDLVKRLDQVVSRLESGELSLEDSLQAFEEGVGLVRQSEARLGEAEKRIELLLSEQGDARVPFDPERSRAEAQVDGAPKGAAKRERAPARDAGTPARHAEPPARDAAPDDDVPF